MIIPTCVSRCATYSGNAQGSPKSFRQIIKSFLSFFFRNNSIMEITATRILILALLIGLASAQINFSTSWGKRSSAAAVNSLPSASFPALTRQQFHSRKEPTLQQQQILPESPAEDRQQPVLPSQCLSLLKSLLWVNQIVEVSKHSRR